MIQLNTQLRDRLVVIGNGMAGARLVEDVLAADPGRFTVTMFGDEPYGNYNRILLSNVLNGAQDAKEIFLNPLAWYEENNVTLHAGRRVTRIDREAKVVYAGDDVAEPYDHLVIATGSKPFVPPIQGTTLHGVFVFRTLDDCRNIADYARDCRSAVVIGGGLLGLEAAKGLMTHHLDVTIVEVAPWLMTVQLDEAGGAVLRQTVERLGLRVRTGTSTTQILGGRAVTGVRFADGTEQAADMVVISAGIRPNVELAKECGLTCERGIVVDDQLRTSDPAVYSVGECAQHRGVVYGLVAPLWEQTKVLADVLTGRAPDRAYAGSKLATKLKVMGVELASMGRVSDVQPGDEVIQVSEPGRNVYWKAVVRNGTVSAACLLGDLTPADDLTRLFLSEAPAPDRRIELFLPLSGQARQAASLADLPDSQQSATVTASARGRSARRSGPGSVRSRPSARRRGPAPAAAVARRSSRG
jgi:nitrite reductase (NADH) large subunit